MSNPFKTAEFKKLQKEWYEKVEADGKFKDIEELHEDPYLKSWALDLGRHSPEHVERTRKYYEEASLLLATYEFKNEMEKRIWTLHSEGFQLLEITKVINMKKYGRTNIYYILKKIKKSMNK